MRFWRDVGEAMMDGFQRQRRWDYYVLVKHIVGDPMPLHRWVYR